MSKRPVVRGLTQAALEAAATLAANRGMRLGDARAMIDRMVLLDFSLETADELVAAAEREIAVTER